MRELLELVGLADKRDADVSSLSRGMQQRLCLAHALVHDPQVLLLDEPASGLDPRARVEMRELLRQLSQMGKTIVISSHILAELAEMCTEVAILERGRVVASGALDTIRQQMSAQKLLRIRVLDDADACAIGAAGLSRGRRCGLAAGEWARDAAGAPLRRRRCRRSPPVGRARRAGEPPFPASRRSGTTWKSCSCA